MCEFFLRLLSLLFFTLNIYMPRSCMTFVCIMATLVLHTRFAAISTYYRYFHPSAHTHIYTHTHMDILSWCFVLNFNSSHCQTNLINLNKFQSEERNSSTENLFNTLHTCQTWCNAQIDNRQDKRIDEHIECILLHQWILASVVVYWFAQAKLSFRRSHFFLPFTFYAMN